MTASPLDHWAEFSAGRLAKPDYIARMHDAAKLLFAYADFLPGSGVDRIEVHPGDVQVVCGKARFYLTRDDVRQPQMEALNFRGFEPHEWDVFLRAIPPGATVFDVGGNIGWYAVRIAAEIPGVTVHSFEPVPHTFAQLERNVRLNALSGVTLYPFGFSEQDGDAEFYFSPTLTGAASAANTQNLDAGCRVSVKLRTLDGFVRETGLVPEFVKCDVEGAELYVVRGGRETLRSAKPVLFLELLRKWAAKFGYHPNEVIDLLAADGFRCFEVSDAGPRPIKQVTDATAATNFVFLHPDKHPELIAEWSRA